MKALCSDGLKRHLYSDIKMNGEVKIGTIYIGGIWISHFEVVVIKGPKEKFIVYRISQITP